jgi:hypothetical protein
MDINSWKEQLLQAILAKLDAATVVAGTCSVCTFDVGIFPWHGYVELSLLCIDEQDLTNAVADWRLYNFSRSQEGQWPESRRLGEQMVKQWTADPSVAERFFEAAGDVVKDPTLRSKLLDLFPACPIEMTVLDPDNRKSRNYAR